MIAKKREERDNDNNNENAIISMSEFFSLSVCSLELCSLVLSCLDTHSAHTR